YFAPLSHPADAIPRVAAVEPPRTAERRVTVMAPNAPLPAVAFSFLVPPVTHPDAAALQVAEAVLSGGESSRLYQSLVYTQQVAVQVGLNADLRADAGLFTIYAVLAGERTAEEGEAAVLAELARLAVEPITEAEVNRAKNLLLTGALADRETNNDRANALARAIVLLGDAERANTAIDELQAVTAADVQRVLAQYLVPTNRLVVHYLPGGEEETGAGE
ncbi:MAG TPA: insulinase family protein, partial [Rhodothermales bacterium]|nr:insulinase family protein [Rhodothermales bacterium]